MPAARKLTLALVALLHLLFASGGLVQCIRPDGHRGLELGLVECECCGPPAESCGETCADACGSPVADEPGQCPQLSVEGPQLSVEGCACGDHPLSVLAAAPERPRASLALAQLLVAPPLLLEASREPPLAWRPAAIPRPPDPNGPVVLRC